MANEEKRLLKVFLCHASGDKPPVRELYKKLVAEGVDAWLDQEKLLPGQDWRLEIPRAVQEADVVVICLSKKSITREGYVQKEIQFALDIAEEKPEGTIFLIPARLEDCGVPDRLSRWQWVDLYEENGFVKLLRSLKLRANKVGAVIEPASYKISDKELQNRLDQLYTDGLAAFYTEDWERACYFFQMILNEQPNHRNAAEKLAEAECERKLAGLYGRSLEAIQLENWTLAIETLRELVQKSADYKNAAQLLRDARKREQLDELYTEARALYAAQKWQAVVRVFKQISIIEPNYPDADGLLASAEKEVAEAERLAGLNEQYSHALREMDAGNWPEARQLLENVHKSQTGFLETEKLLQKAENEITKQEERRKQNEQIDTLYEQAHGLVRLKKWQNALDKLEEIRKLDDAFHDTDAIGDQARKELERGQQEAEQQNKLAAMYAEAVRSLKEGKYQEALDKWQEVRTIDPKYPDRQWVQKTARWKLEGTVRRKPWIARPRLVSNKMISLVVMTAVIVGAIIVLLNNAPEPRVYDDFGDSAYDGTLNSALWEITGDTSFGSIRQEQGILIFAVNEYKHIIGASVKKSLDYGGSPWFVEARVMLDSDTTKNGTDIGMHFDAGAGYSVCAIFAGPEKQQVSCFNHYFGADQRSYQVEIASSTWHALRIEVHPEKMMFIYKVDGREIGLYIYDDGDRWKSINYGLNIRMNNWGDDAKNPVGQIDYIRIGTIEDDPTLK